jgi:hypothetical protein
VIHLYDHDYDNVGANVDCISSLPVQGFIAKGYGTNEINVYVVRK